MPLIDRITHCQTGCALEPCHVGAQPAEIKQQTMMQNRIFQVIQALRAMDAVDRPGTINSTRTTKRSR
jgi:hypothetical protein